MRFLSSLDALLSSNAQLMLGKLDVYNECTSKSTTKKGPGVQSLVLG